MAVKKGRSQARRNSGNSGGLPGWAWMVLGIVITLAVVLAAPRLLKSDGDDGFYRPRANPDATPAPADSASQPAAATTAASAPADTTARYLLQAGSFSASGDAEALKARIALLGLGARVESSQVQGRTVYRVRMGPYGTASELADAKGKLEGGGLEALPIKVQ